MSVAVIRISAYEAKGIHPCFICGMFHVVKFNSARDLTIGMKRLDEGALIQNAFPNLTAGEREVFMTGACDKAFQAMCNEIENEGE